MNYITLVLLVHGAVQVGLIIDIFLDGETRDKADDWFQTEASNAIVGIMIGFAAFDGIALSLILQLVFFHMQLRKEGLTTYKFIVRETQKKREKRDNEQDRKNKRMVAMGKANDEGNYMLACKLRYGEMIPCIDPLPKDGVEEKKEEDTQRPHNDVSSDDVGPASGSQQIQQPANGTENGYRTETDKQDSIDEENEELPPQEDEEAGPNGDVKKGENGKSDGVQFIKVSEGDS